MSLSSALNASVSALKSQSIALAAVSQNIANASTTAYKTTSVSFESLITGGSSSSAKASGAVTTSVAQNMTQQGQISTTSTSTNIAISGNGFFVVSDNLENTPSAYNYSRNGEFTTDADGYLINNEGYYLLGQKTDENGNVLAVNSNDLNSLEPIDVTSISGSAKATSEVTFDLNLPADAANNSVFETSFELFDSLGVSHTVTQTWEKTAANTWTLTLSDPALTDDLGTPSGTIAPSTINITFDGDGNLASYSSNAITITGFNTGASDSAFTVDLGTIGRTDGLTQFSSNTDTPDIEISLIDSDGVRYGQLSSIEIDDTGLVTALFDNGLRQTIYQVPIATFPNPGGLTHINGTVYDENQNAGNYNLRLPGEGNAGTVVAGALEMSMTDTSEEFNKMIIAQQAYSSAAQVVSTVSDMFDTLISSVR
jgi:flagellar hook protein FlgE